jgi:chemotaxis protein histidine kinase CheA
LGLPHATHEDLNAALFAEGLSTQHIAGEISGRGVGLSAVAQAVKALGGTLVVTSLPQKGTTFEISIPVTEDDALVARFDSTHPQIAA